MNLGVFARFNVAASGNIGDYSFLQMCVCVQTIVSACLCAFYTVCIVLAAPWAAAAAGLSAITVNPDILWLCILHTSHPLKPSALRISPQHCAKGLPPKLTQPKEGDEVDGDGETTSWTLLRISSRTNPNVFSLQCQM